MKDYTNKASIRNSNIEFLRIMSMVMIILYHFMLHSYNLKDTGLKEKIFLDVIGMGGKLAVNIFVIIIGYYGIDNEGKNTKKVFALWRQGMFYSLLFGSGYFLYYKKIELEVLKKILFPTTFSSWWFLSAIIVLYMLAPFINKMLLALNKKEFIELIIILLIFWSVLPFISCQTYGLNWNQQIQVIIMYILGSFLKKNDSFIKNITARKWGMCAFISILGESIIVILFEVRGNFKVAEYLRAGNSPISIFLSVAIFVSMAFKSYRCAKMTNCVALYMFDVYLWHENFLINEQIWKSIYNLKCEIHILAIVAVVVIMGVGIIIGILRRKLDLWIYNKLWCKMEKKIDFYNDRIYSFLVKK